MYVNVFIDSAILDNAFFSYSFISLPSSSVHVVLHMLLHLLVTHRSLKLCVCVFLHLFSLFLGLTVFCLANNLIMSSSELSSLSVTNCLVITVLTPKGMDLVASFFFNCEWVIISFSCVKSEHIMFYRLLPLEIRIYPVLQIYVFLCRYSYCLSSIFPRQISRFFVFCFVWPLNPKLGLPIVHVTFR